MYDKRCECQNPERLNGIEKKYTPVPIRGCHVMVSTLSQSAVSE
jgi:hypothetical protein